MRADDRFFMSKANLDDFLNEQKSVILRANATGVKIVQFSLIKALREQNAARKLAGLSLIELKVRKCIVCSGSFLSAGQHNCGCTKKRGVGFIAGRDIL